MNIPDYVRDYIANIADGGDYEFADNFRAAKEGDIEANNQYEKLKSEGCCGYYDNEVIIQGETWKIGFNYGH